MCFLLAWQSFSQFGIKTSEMKLIEKMSNSLAVSELTIFMLMKYCWFTLALKYLGCN